MDIPDFRTCCIEQEAFDYIKKVLVELYQPPLDMSPRLQPNNGPVKKTGKGKTKRW